MANPTRFSSGVSTRAPGDPLANLAMPDPTRYHTFFDDFDNYTLADWVITTVETGTATEAVATGEKGGILVLTNGTADLDLDQLQYSGATGTSTVETFKFTTGKRTFFKARFKLTDGNSAITEVGAFIGLSITDTSVSVSAPSDAVYFTKAEGDALCKFTSILNSTTTGSTGTAGTMTVDTYHEVGFYFDGKITSATDPAPHLFAYFDGVEVLRYGTGTASPYGNFCTDEELAVSFGIINGRASAAIMSIDYFFVAQER